MLALHGVDEAAPRTRQLVVQLKRAPSATLRRQLVASGFQELAYLSTNALVVERRTGSVSALAALEDVEGVGAYLQSDRLSREFANAPSALGAGEVSVLVHVMPGADPEPLRAHLAARGLSVVANDAAGGFGRLATKVAASEARGLAQNLSELSEVFFVERVPHLGFFNDRSAGSVQSGTPGTSSMATPIWAHGLRGEGQVVGLIDTGVDIDSCFFADAAQGKLPKTNTWSAADGYGVKVDATHRKVLAYDFLYSCDQWPGARGCDRPSVLTAFDSAGHGTHCAGSMVGKRASGGQNGMAPEAKLVVQDAGLTSNTCSDLAGLGCPVIDLYPLFEQAYRQGVRLHNNSYGDNEEAPAPNTTNYTARSQDVDRFVWDHKDMLIVFAAGNSGTRNTDFTVASPSTNKNGLSVGSARTSATGSDDNISSFSSRGLTADGRFKPDILAPGCTVSAGNDGRIGTNNCGEDTGCGTSYAAPILVGSAALVRQYFVDGFYPSGQKRAADALVPSAALLKAVLLNGAVPMTGRDNAGQSIDPPPSHEQGWGRVQLEPVLAFENGARQLFVDDHKLGFAAGEADERSYTFKGVSADEPFKVTLVWTDYPATPDSPPRAPSVDNLAALNAPRLVNDLDLEVRSAQKTWLGNVFASGSSREGGAPDRRNNVEQVLVTESGELRVVVKAANVAKESQDFALVVTGRWESVAMQDDSAPDAGTQTSRDASVQGASDAGASPSPEAAAPISGPGAQGSDASAPPTQTFGDPVTTGVGEAGAPLGAPIQNDAGTGIAASETDSGGCACRTSGGAGSRGDALLSALAFALLWWRRGSKRRER